MVVTISYREYFVKKSIEYNIILRCQPWTCSFTVHCSSLLNCMGEYLATCSGGCLCTNSLRTVTVVLLNVSQRSRDGVRLNRCASRAHRLVSRTGH